MDEDIYFKSSVGKINYILDMYRQEQEAKVAAYSGKAPTSDTGTIKAHKFSEAIGGALNG